MQEVYLDSNILIYGVLNEDQIGDSARRFIKEIETGKYKASISALTIDEFIWKVQKVLGREEAAKLADKLMEMQNLKIIDINLDILKKMLEIYKKYNLDPRDSIHLAAMQLNEIKIIISQDSDFDKIKDIKRIDFSK